jgi:hypothetical protein
LQMDSGRRRSATMKRAILILAVLALCNIAIGQTVVSKAGKLAWTDPNPAGAVTHFRVYVSGTPGIVPDGTSFVAEIPAPAIEWTISSDVGSPSSLSLCSMAIGRTHRSHRATV